MADRDPGVPARWIIDDGVAFSALLAVGISARLRNLVEAARYVGGGFITARLGDYGARVLVGAFTIAGAVLVRVVDSPAAAIAATLLIVGWTRCRCGSPSQPSGSLCPTAIRRALALKAGLSRPVTRPATTPA